MKIIRELFKNSKFLTLFISIKLLILATGIGINGQSAKSKGVMFERLDDQQKVNVIVNGSLFTTYNYPVNFEKPFLYPVFAPMDQLSREDSRDREKGAG
jgi:hypothetical protein